MFREMASITRNKTQDSPYGTFSDWTKCNPYDDPYNEDGTPKKSLSTGYSPLYNAMTGTKDETSYLQFTNNFYTEWTPIDALKLTARVSMSTKRSDADEYYPYTHTKFSGIGRDYYYQRGSYTVNNGKSNTLSADLMANYTKAFDKHVLSANAAWSISETEFIETVVEAIGIQDENMDEFLFATMYPEGAVPTGVTDHTRSLGATGVLAYAYDERFLFDGTIRMSAASVFGEDKPWATFWSLGIGWNLHNEHFFKSIPYITQLKIRGSIGTTGNQNFQSNKSIATYKYFKEDAYCYYWNGTYLNNMKNPGLEWEQKKDDNIGIDFATKHMTLTADWYRSDTENMVSQISLPGSTGFTQVSENLGLVRNEGFEVALGLKLINNKDYYLNVSGMIATNTNKLKKISDAMNDYNNQQRALAAASDAVVPNTLYENGQHMNTIWAVPSLGIDPSDGYEMYVARDGSLTKNWSSANIVACGIADDKYNGNFGINGMYKNFGMSVVFTFRGGGDLYNQTLVDKVENVQISQNVDKRVLYGRWREYGQWTQFRRIRNDYSSTGDLGHTEGSKTRATSRFVQKNNELNFSSLSVYYDLPKKWMSPIGFERVRLQANMNDIYKWSSIEIERGTSYPFARTLSLSLSATF